MTVKQGQYLLLYLGYAPGGADGIWGEKTKAACREFQRDYGLRETEGWEDAVGNSLIDAVAGRLARAEKKEGFWEEIRWFRREEFKCKCGGRYCGGFPAEMQESVVRIADAARAHFGKPAHVVSGLRCEKWNAHEGGMANSQHMYGEACDLRIDGVDSETLRQFVASQPGHRYSYRINGTNVHFDINPGKR